MYVCVVCVALVRASVGRSLMRRGLASVVQAAIDQMRKVRRLSLLSAALIEIDRRLLVSASKELMIWRMDAP